MKSFYYWFLLEFIYILFYFFRNLKKSMKEYVKSENLLVLMPSIRNCEYLESSMALTSKKKSGLMMVVTFSSRAFLIYWSSKRIRKLGW